MGGVVVFLGPTLDRERARAVLPEAAFLPPARRGDITRLVLDEHPAVIVLIDGLFDTVPSVAHKEVLFALTRRIRVIGAASMGALRAAELWTFGMEGIGEIFRRFKEGLWEFDDEVAVVHGDAETGFRPGSVALANIRLGLEAAAERGIITAKTGDRLAAGMRDVFYPDRNWPRVFAAARSMGVEETQTQALMEFVTTQAPDAKRDDALAALAHARRLQESGEPLMPPSADYDFEPTGYWELLVREARAVPAGRARDDLQRHLPLHRHGRELLRGAVLLQLLHDHASDDADVITAAQAQRALNRFRRRHGLHSAQQARDFYAEQHLDEDSLRLLAWLEAAVDRLVEDRAEQVTRWLALELKRRGEFAAAAGRAAGRGRLLGQLGTSHLSLEDLGLSLTDLLEWYQQEFETIEGSLEEHVRSLGFASEREFVTEVTLEYQLRKQRRELRHPPQKDQIGEPP